jgi:secreted PhoX family phosphatase
MRMNTLLIFIAIGLLVGLSGSPLVQAQSQDGDDQMIRIMMLPPEAEVTGMYVDDQGRFFVNAMHPDEDNYKATIGIINGVDWNNLPDVVPELASTSQPSEVWHGIRTGYGEYQVLLQAGDALSDGKLAGGIYSVNDGQQILLSEKPDFNAFIPANQDGTNGFLYTAWEDRPAGISQLEIQWNPTSNQWDVLNSQMLNLSSINGGWVLCFGTVSPWGSPLFSEELYFDDTEDWNNPNYRYHNDQLRLETYLGNYPNPYDYGFIIEMEDAKTSNPEFTRHYSMGRYSHENAQVMPDNKTVYLSDDGYDTVLYKFVADNAGDLSKGTLYAAKLTQDATYDSSTTGFNVDWIELGSSSNSEILSWIEDYDGITTDDYVAGQNAYISDQEINDWAEGRLNQDLNNDGIIGYSLDDRVAFLETRKAAAALGATDEWNKMEGVVYNPQAPDYAYLAMSNIDRAMTDGQGDIDVSTNYCGIVYRMPVLDGYDIDRIDPVIIGGPYTSSAQYECDINNLAGPDNLLVLNDGSVLVGEDTKKHQYNMVWLWREYIEPVIEVDERIQLNSINAINQPEDLTRSWTYELQAEVSDLAVDTTYTALIVAKNETTEEWNGMWWWNDIQSDSMQYQQSIALDRGCYIIEGSLYEKNDLNSNAGDAIVLDQFQQELVVGSGTCSDGIYSELVEQNEDNSTDFDKDQNSSVPGFGILLFLTSVLLAFFKQDSFEN